MINTKLNSPFNPLVLLNLYFAFLFTLFSSLAKSHLSGAISILVNASFSSLFYHICPCSPYSILFYSFAFFPTRLNSDHMHPFLSLSYKHIHHQLCNFILKSIWKIKKNRPHDIILIFKQNKTKTTINHKQMFNCLCYINAIMHSSNKLHKTVKSIQHMFSQARMRTQRTSYLSDSINLCTCMQTDTS